MSSAAGGQWSMPVRDGIRGLAHTRPVLYHSDHIDSPLTFCLFFCLVFTPCSVLRITPSCVPELYMVLEIKLEFTACKKVP